MAIPITTILTWCGIIIVAQRTRIMNKLLIAPEGMRHLNDELTKVIIATFRDYSRRDVADGKINFQQSSTETYDLTLGLGEGHSTTPRGSQV